MSDPWGTKVGDSIDFKWGIQRGVGRKNKDTHFYESFVYDGVEYFLYDCAYFYHDHHVETSVGKLVKIYERPTHEKVVKVVWFFRPSEIRNFLGDYQPRWNELFLASGAGKGLSNINPLESIIGKCSVFCTSMDKRNPEPSETELKTADFLFNCAFDVGRRAIIDKFADEIDGIEVGKFFNRKGEKKPSNPLHVGRNTSPKILIKSRTDPSDKLRRPVEDNAEVRSSENVVPKSSSHSFPYKKRKIEDDNPPISQSSKSSKDKEFDEKETKLRQHKRVNTCSKVIEVAKGPDAGKIAGKSSSISQSSKSHNDGEFDEKVAKLGQDSRAKTGRKVTEVTERPDAEKRRWFKRRHWDQRLQEAQEMDTLVLLNNLDPSYTSYEVEDLVWHALKKKVEARVIERSLNSNKYYGRALVIFKTKDAADYAITELKRRCLILGDGRIVSAQKGTLREPGKQGKFTGHLAIDRFAHQKQRQEMRNAVSTSHCAQSNTIEYGMATEWLLQYKKSDAWWEALYQKQMEEIEDVKNKLKMDKIFLETS